MYREYKQLNLPQIGKEVLEFWQQNNIFEKSISSRPADIPYTFYEGPPSANGMPGIHHAMARSIKDIFCRYKTLKGYQVKRKGGWDTHGLPIELAVEKSLWASRKMTSVKKFPLKIITLPAARKYCAIHRYLERSDRKNGLLG